MIFERMMLMKKKISISIVQDKTYGQSLEDAKLDGKSFFNKCMFFLFLLGDIFCTSVLLEDLLQNMTKINQTQQISNLLCLISICLILSLPAIYYLLKILNFQFYINKEKICYQNIFGKSYQYPIEEIKETIFYRGNGEEVNSLLIQLKNNKRIRFSSSDRNFLNVQLFVAKHKDICHFR